LAGVGLIPSRRKELLERLIKYPGALVELKGSLEELEFAIQVYGLDQLNCKEVLDQDRNLTGIICRADDLLYAVEQFDDSTQFEEF